MSTINLIKELISFYVKENYKDYLNTNNIDKIPKQEISHVVSNIYQSKKDHLKIFLKESLKEVMKEEYVGDLVVNNICNDIYNDDNVCITKLTQEIIKYQDSMD
tara:strand:+ start:746 stop:1057 length:312 start_codon:yes stop_codon:yes gene_type:complete